MMSMNFLIQSQMKLYSYINFFGNYSYINLIDKEAGEVLEWKEHLEILYTDQFRLSSKAFLDTCCVCVASSALEHWTMDTSQIQSSRTLYSEILNGSTNTPGCFIIFHFFPPKSNIFSVQFDGVFLSNASQ